MILRDLLSALPAYQVQGDAGIEIAGLSPDSRRVEPGYLFVAYRGENVDGHRFAPQAAARGAAAMAGEAARPAALPAEMPYVQVPNGREALAHLAAAWYGHPGRQMTIVGVTGTEGKTTTVNLLQSIFAAAGKKTGMISTINAVVGDEYRDTGLHVSTPDALPVQALLAEMAAAGTEVVVLEATSHGLAQHRVTAVEFDVGVVTNVRHSHLNYHGTWEQYLADKARLLRALSTSWPKPGVPKVAVLNADDISYPHLAPIPVPARLTYGLQEGANVTAVDLQQVEGRQCFTIGWAGEPFAVCTPLLGEYNVYNVLAAAAAALALGIEPAAVQAGVAALQAMPGRMERIDEGQDFAAIVDFAHSPNGLEQALRSLLKLRAPGGRLIVVFGCAGERDVLQREMMGEIAGRLADVTVLTAEDPRSEDLRAILDQIAAGCERAGAVEGRDYLRVPDRGAAIVRAVEMAGPGDVVVAQGKGHEQSMCFDGIEYPWDDRTALRAALRTRLGLPIETPIPWLPTSDRPREGA